MSKMLLEWRPATTSSFSRPQWFPLRSLHAISSSIIGVMLFRPEVLLLSWFSYMGRCLSSLSLVHGGSLPVEPRVGVIP